MLVIFEREYHRLMNYKHFLYEYKSRNLKLCYYDNND